MNGLLALLLAAAAPAPVEGLKVFQDWIVGCDNGRVCRAEALIPANQGDGWSVLDVNRDAAAGAPASFEIEQAPDGVAAVSAGGRRQAARRDKNDEIELPPAFTPAVIAATRTSPTLELLDAGGAVIGRVSLAGASAALLYMDDRQRRVGTTTALVRAGQKPASSVPPPPTLPTATSAAGSAKPPLRLGARAVAKLRGDNACKADADRKDDLATFARLDAAHTLALVTMNCISGEYNIESDAYILTDGQPDDPQPAEFAKAPGETGEGDDVSADGVEWDAQARVLHTGMLGRGFGDCGLWRDYVWDGRRFRPVQQDEMGECRGGMDRITTWRAAVRR